MLRIGHRCAHPFGRSGLLIERGGGLGTAFPLFSWAGVAALLLLVRRSATPSDVYAAARPSLGKEVVHRVGLTHCRTMCVQRMASL